jgi:hypothetical protein
MRCCVTQVLRPRLYERLKLLFKEVRVSNRGTRANMPVDPERRGRPRRRLNKRLGDYPGEFYVICCPYCHDRRFRLYVNHLWGQYDAATDSRNLWMAFCQNENCLNGYDRQEAFYKLVWDDTTPWAAGQDVVLLGQEQPATLGEVHEPGTIWRLDRVVPDHPACQYVRSRDFDPVRLGAQLGVGYIAEVAEHKMEYLVGRLYIPVREGGRLIGWQARLLYDPPKGGSPKYVFNTGFPRNTVLYNLERARQYPYVVVLEGAPKVWRFGPDSVCTFGKGITGYQASVLQATWKTIVVMLDPDARQESHDLVELLKASSQVVEVLLPDGVEPDEVPQAVARGYAREAIARAGISLTAKGGSDGEKRTGTAGDASDHAAV